MIHVVTIFNACAASLNAWGGHSQQTGVLAGRERRMR